MKTNDAVKENDIIGKFKYRNDFVIVLNENGNGIQLIGVNDVKFNWLIKENTLVVSDLIGISNGKMIHYGKQVYIISKDYRDYYYPFGSPYDFDNHEIWDKTQ